ncbi:MAG TPA: zinc dependent phospholipase C family protein [Anaerovoracaceae bacterium]|nr:zinc dependent phospholipase C family protein [Anaerovoracaceae bacterium]
MNFFTHIMISKALYRQLSQRMELDPKAFSYGNIKPDLSPKCLRDPHLLENYLLIVSNDSNRLIGENPELKQFSTDLGVICHYICDFFCFCHLDSRIYHRLLFHFIYELRLHLAFCSMRAKNKICFRLIRRIPKGKSIASIVMELRKEYMTKQKTFQRDIEYALMASFLACELISRFAKSAASADAGDSKAGSDAVVQGIL